MFAFLQQRGKVFDCAPGAYEITVKHRFYIGKIYIDSIEFIRK